MSYYLNINSARRNSVSVSIIKPLSIGISNGSAFGIIGLLNFKNFFVQDGIVEFFNDELVLLSSSAKNVKSLTKEFVDNLNKDVQNELQNKNITDHDRYVLHHKLDVLKGIRV